MTELVSTTRVRYYFRRRALTSFPPAFANDDDTPILKRDNSIRAQRQRSRLGPNFWAATYQVYFVRRRKFCRRF
jgi:hypothetical protein